MTDNQNDIRVKKLEELRAFLGLNNKQMAIKMGYGDTYASQSYTNLIKKNKPVTNNKLFELKSNLPDLNLNFFTNEGQPMWLTDAVKSGNNDHLFKTIQTLIKEKDERTKKIAEIEAKMELLEKELEECMKK